MICSKVDLPQPDGPITDMKLPRSISRSTPLSATVVPPAAAKVLRMPRRLRKGREGFAMRRSGHYEYAFRDVDRLLEQAEFLHQLHSSHHAGCVHGGAKLRQQHLVFERGVEARPGLVDV